MVTDSDEDTTELEIQSKTFHKMKNRMKILGYQEGVSKGRENLVQEGFNLGYIDGFKLGLHLGRAKAKIGFKAEMQTLEKEKLKMMEMSLDQITKETCKTCLSAKSEQEFEDNNTSFQKSTLDQQNYNSQIIMALESSDLWE